MAKNKNKPSNNNSANQSNGLQQGTMAHLLQKVVSASSSVESVINKEQPGQNPPDLSKLTPEKLDKADAALKEELQKELENIARHSKLLIDINEKLDRRYEEFSRKEEAINKRGDENKRRTEELTRNEEAFKKNQADFNKKESELIDKERWLEERELDARSGFAKQNSAALSDLKKEIAELESRRNELQLSLHQTEQKARDDENERLAVISEKEIVVSEKERSTDLQKRRLDAEWKELERERESIRKDALQEADREINRWKTECQKTKERLEKVYNDLTTTLQHLEEYREISQALAGRPPRALVDELADYKRRITQLENQIASSEGEQLRSENTELRKTRDQLKIQLDQIHNDFAEANAERHSLRLGVSDKESLEREKRILEKHKQLLAAKLDELGQRVDDLTQSQQADKPFRQMSWMDMASNADWINEKRAKELNISEQEVPDLKNFSVDLQHRIAQAEGDAKLFFRLEDIQLFIAGLAMSQLHIFQGISGTGKTSLAKAFAKAVGGHCTDIAVQAGWRDRDDLLGHYNAFEKRFYERDCLQGLYRSQTSAYKDRCNVILLDEMNLSRPEQYFAEFLSALEKNDPKERLISLSESKLPNTPQLFVEGRKIRVPPNVWFIGTANHDETTNEFADKTYDRAHVMTQLRPENSFSIESKSKISYSYASLDRQFENAIRQYSDEVKELLEELATGSLTDILKDRFDLGWGHRFERQAMRFVPVFMATGGQKEDALDHLLATRVFRKGKVTGRYNIRIEDLTVVEQALSNTWKHWNSEPKQSYELLKNDLMRMQRERGA